MFPFPTYAQWSGAAGSTDYTSNIQRDGNIEVNRLTFGRYGSAILDDTNPFSIFSRHDAGAHDLLLFGNSQAVLHLRLYDGDLKIGNAGVPNTTLFNNGSAYFLENVGIGTANPLGKLHIKGGHIVIDVGSAGDPIIFAGTGANEYNRYLRLINSTELATGSGLKSSGILVADSYNYANPGKNDLVVKGNVSVGTVEAAGYKLAVAGKAVAEEIVVKSRS